MFDTVAVIGLGLIGGSLALELKRLKLVDHILGYDVDVDHCKKAEMRGLADQVFNDWNDKLFSVDLLVIAIPVGQVSSVVEQCHHWLNPRTIVTDVGSVKKPILVTMQNYPAINFVGGHPIAGSENFGPESAKTGLLKDKNFIVTPTDDTSPQALEIVKKLWSAVGCQVHEMDAELHDKIFASVSHLPHLLAYATIEAIGTSGTPEILKYFGAGLKDFSRIASSSPLMWADIFIENRDHLLATVSHARQIIENMETLVREQNHLGLMELLARSKNLRDSWIN
jgi:prephenate dehydrogenase